MIVTWLKERREFRDRVGAEADRLQAQHGRAAYATAAIAARTVGGDWRFAEAVRDELGRRIGYRRPAEEHQLFLARAV
ncbi:MAG TPA: hypothetical protein VD906_09540 [Caulobacteraceae bacterium]|nr:hypothetical protein [Caulobacteraceae bacterium]